MGFCSERERENAKVKFRKQHEFM